MKRGLIIDLFAGGGGASEGIRRALGRSPNICVNHDVNAVKMHEANHGDAWHLCESVYDVDPKLVCAGEPVALLWASPDCKHFSKAKGGRPVEKGIRGLAWVVVKWAMDVRPGIIMLENVEEFLTWGPLIQKTVDGAAQVDGNGEPVMIPDPAGKGLIFKMWKQALVDLGYRVEHRILKACDFGAPTTRKRLFIIARRDGKKITWPKHSHGPGTARPYRTAAECIDWSLPCPSIFERKRPLAEKTLARIARGVMRYVVLAKEPFIVTCNHGGDGFRGQAVGEPMRTVTAAKDAHGIVVPTIAKHYGGVTGHEVTRPLGTITSVDHHSLVMAHLKRDFGKSVGQSLRRPAPTATMSNHSGLVTALLKRWNGAKGVEDRCQDPGQPLSTIDTQPRFGVVTPFLAKICQTGSNGKMCNGADEPLTTIVSKNEHLLCAPHLTKLYGTSTGSPMESPAPTVTAGGQHAGIVAAFLQKYYGQGTGQELRGPMHTIPTLDRFGLVTVAIGGEDYVITDIGMRMLTPRELARAQGFSDSYILTGSNANQIARIGNSVPPQFAEALVRANCRDFEFIKAVA